MPPVVSQPARVQIVEVGPRDGLQAEARTLSTDTKVRFIERLLDAGHTVIEATSFVSPTAVPQLADAAELMARLPRREGVRYPVLVPNERGLERALTAGAREIAVFVAASESYSRKNLNRSRDEALAIATTTIARARAAGARVRGYISMVIADPWDGATDPAAVADIAARLLRDGCDDLSLGDTLGSGTPGHVRRLLGALIGAGIPASAIGMHFHDTYGQALANVMAALEMGVTAYDASTGGIGGSPFAKQAAGNLATEDLVWMLDGLGVATGVDVRQLAAISQWMGGELGHDLPARVSRALQHVTA